MDEVNDIGVQCRNLIRYGAILADCTAKQMKVEKNYDAKLIGTLNKIVADLSSMRVELKTIETEEKNVDYEDPMQIGEILKIGDLYNDWMHKYTAGVMPRLEDIKNELTATEVEETPNE